MTIFLTGNVEPLQHDCQCQPVNSQKEWHTKIGRLKDTKNRTNETFFEAVWAHRKTLTFVILPQTISYQSITKNLSKSLKKSSKKIIIVLKKSVTLQRFN